MLSILCVFFWNPPISLSFSLFFLSHIFFCFSPSPHLFLQSYFVLSIFNDAFSALSVVSRVYLYILHYLFYFHKISLFLLLLFYFLRSILSLSLTLSCPLSLDIDSKILSFLISLIFFALVFLIILSNGKKVKITFEI